MVSPSSEWDEEENGYSKGDSSVFVRPKVVQSSSGVVAQQTVERGDENAYGVEMMCGPAGHARHATICNFSDEKPAWELANLLTRYVDHVRDCDVAKGNINNPHPGHTVDLPDVVEDMSGEEVLREKLGHYSYQLDEILDS